MGASEEAVKPGEETTPSAPATPAEDNPSADSPAPVQDDDDDDFSAEDDSPEVKAAMAATGDEEQDEETDANKPASDEAKDPEAEQPKDPEQPNPRSKEAREAQLKTEIAETKERLGLDENADVRALVEEKNLLRELEQANGRKAENDLVQELLNMENPETGEPYTPEEAGRLARAAVAEAESERAGNEAYQLGVQHNQNVIRRETQKAMQDFPIFMEKLPDGTDNPDYDPEWADFAGQMLLDAFVYDPVLGGDGKPVADEQGNPKQVVVNIKRSPYQIMKSVAERAKAAQAKTEARARAAADKQAANADVPVSGNTRHTPADVTQDFDKAWDEYD